MKCIYCEETVIAYSSGSSICQKCNKVFNTKFLEQAQSKKPKEPTFQRIGHEFRMELVARFDKHNMYPVKADWYDVALSTGAATMTIPLDWFLKFAESAKALAEKENETRR